MSSFTPLITCHYGNSYYLPYVFKCVNRTNPGREIILLGDDSNRWLADELDITHYYFKKYNRGNLVSEFEDNYRLIQGEEHVNDKGGDKDWINFVFKRWFYIEQFVSEQGIQSFWHFDTDTMVLDDLTRHEQKYQDYDCTEQCNGICMNGFIGNPAVVTQYLKKINDIFQREELLHQQQQEFDRKNPGFAFTEMRAYQIFKEEEHISTYHLAEPMDGEVFDDSLGNVENYESEKNGKGRKIKKIYLDNYGRFYGKKLDSGVSIRFITLNMSRVQEDYYYKVLRHITTNYESGNLEKPIETKGSAMSIPYPFRLRVRPFLNRLRRVKHKLF